MQHPVGKEINILDLVPGEKYYAFATSIATTIPKYFRGVFTEYWYNSVNYKMLRFHNAFESYGDGYTSYIGSPENYPLGLYYRIWETQPQSFTYYKVSRFTEAEKAELKARCILRERRQIERGLTGSTVNNLWLPRDLVREISLNYLTDKRIHKKSKYDTAASRLAREYHGHVIYG